MWIVEQKDEWIVGVDLSMQDGNCTIFPVFTNPDAAVAFIGELDSDGSVRMRRIDSINLVSRLIDTIKSSEISMIALNLPNVNDITFGTPIIYFQVDKFIDILECAVDVANEYGEKHALDTLNKYLHIKVQLATDQTDEQQEANPQ